MCHLALNALIHYFSPAGAEGSRCTLHKWRLGGWERPPAVQVLCWHWRVATPDRAAKQGRCSAGQQTSRLRSGGLFRGAPGGQWSCTETRGEAQAAPRSLHRFRRTIPLGVCMPSRCSNVHASALKRRGCCDDGMQAKASTIIPRLHAASAAARQGAAVPADTPSWTRHEMTSSNKHARKSSIAVEKGERTGAGKKKSAGTRCLVWPLRHASVSVGRSSRASRL